MPGPKQLSALLRAEKARATAAALVALAKPKALADAQEHIENLGKLEAISGVAKRRDLRHGVLTLGLVLAAVGVAVGWKLGSVAAAASVSAREMAMRTTSVLVQVPAVYRSARVMLGGDTGVDALERRALAAEQVSVAVTEMRQTSDVLSVVLRHAARCQTLSVQEGALAVSISSVQESGTAVAHEVILKGAPAQAASIELCGSIEQPLTLAARLVELSVEQRLHHGTLSTDVLPSMVSGQVDVNGKRIMLTPLDVLRLRLVDGPGEGNSTNALVEVATQSILVRMSGKVSELRLGAVHDTRDELPSLLETMSRDRPVGVLYTTVLAAFAFVWGLRRVLT